MLCNSRFIFSYEERLQVHGSKGKNYVEVLKTKLKESNLQNQDAPGAIPTAPPPWNFPDKHF